ALALPGALRDLADFFVFLQEERHRADYNLALPFTRTEVLTILRELNTVVAGWQRVRMAPAARFFLMTLPLWDPLSRRIPSGNDRPGARLRPRPCRVGAAAAP